MLTLPNRLGRVGSFRPHSGQNPRVSDVAEAVGCSDQWGLVQSVDSFSPFLSLLTFFFGSCKCKLPAATDCCHSQAPSQRRPTFGHWSTTTPIGSQRGSSGGRERESSMESWCLSASTIAPPAAGLNLLRARPRQLPLYAAQILFCWK